MATKTLKSALAAGVMWGGKSEELFATADLIIVVLSDISVSDDDYALNIVSFELCSVSLFDFLKW